MREWFSIIYTFILVGWVLSSCQKTEELIDFTEEDEILLGEKLVATFIESNNYNIIPRESNSVAYNYANSRLQELVSTSFIAKGEDFIWNITLLDDQSRQAFALPGGSIYVTSGMIFYLENEDQFSGLLAHLVAHVNESHLTERLFFKYGVNGLKDFSDAGSEEELNRILDDLDLFGDFLPLSRASELEADTLSISILSETSQSCEAGGQLLTRLLNVQPSGQAAFIGAHRIESFRVENIQNTVSESGCDAAIDDESGVRYRSFRNSLP